MSSFRGYYVYVDANVFVKHYVEEEHSERVRDEIFTGRAEIFTLSLTRIEVIIALCRYPMLYPEKGMGKEAVQQIIRAMGQDWRYWNVLRLSRAVAARAISLACRHTLKTNDALHLAAAVTLQKALSVPITIATFDKRLHAVAQKEGLSVWPPVL